MNAAKRVRTRSSSGPKWSFPVEVDRDVLLSAASHDLRVPIGAMKMFIAAIRQQLSRRGRHIAASIALLGRSLAEMDRLVGDLMDAAAAAPYQVRIEISATSFGSILSDALKAARALGRERRVRIEAKPVGRLVVSCDRARVRQVLSNLLSNAVRVSDDGATVRVVIRRQVSSVRVSVHHLGSTISTLSAEGTAVGLYIAKKLVEAQGGLIWLEEDADGGAICNFTLPLAPRSAPAA